MVKSARKWQKWACRRYSAAAAPPVTAAAATVAADDATPSPVAAAVSAVVCVCVGGWVVGVCLRYPQSALPPKSSSFSGSSSILPRTPDNRISIDIPFHLAVAAEH